MFQLLLARTVSSLCNCVTFFSGGHVSANVGSNLNYRGFNKSKNDKTEYEIDSLLMEDDLVDELVATPLSAEEIAAKLSSNVIKKNDLNNLNYDNKSGLNNNWLINNSKVNNARNVNNSDVGIDITVVNNNKINDWWSDEDNENDYDSFKNSINNEQVINYSLFNANSHDNSNNNNNLFSPNSNNLFENKDFDDLYFEEVNDEFAAIQNNIINNNGDINLQNFKQELNNNETSLSVEGASEYKFSNNEIIDNEYVYNNTNHDDLNGIINEDIISNDNIQYIDTNDKYNNQNSIDDGFIFNFESSESTKLNSSSDCNNNDNNNQNYTYNFDYGKNNNANTNNLNNQTNIQDGNNSKLLDDFDDIFNSHNIQTNNTYENDIDMFDSLFSKSPNKTQANENNQSNTAQPAILFD